ncbi:hypothetical protein U0070_020480 [Myodes glareolus]|uniref:Uncharacterized protein n=1 Tax=Myodes glareolus TaxID=447135 RepID=A0AAW0HXK0_MYOGA
MPFADISKRYLFYRSLAKVHAEVYKWNHDLREKSENKSKQIAFCADIAPANAVNIPKSCWAFCKKCGKHKLHKVPQYKKSKDSLYGQKQWCCDQNQSGYDEQTEPIFHRKVKTTKKAVLRLESAETGER